MTSDLVDSLVADLTKLWKDADDYDVQITVGEPPDTKTFGAHSMMLRKRCKYFHKQFKTRKDGEVAYLSEPNINPKVFESILSYIYTGLVELSDDTDLLDLILAANALELGVLVDHIQIDVISNRSYWIEENVTELYIRTSTIPSLATIFNRCQELIVKRPEAVFQSPGYTAMDKGVLIDLLRNDTLAMEEIDVWDCVIAWGVQRSRNIITVNPETWSLQDVQEMKQILNDLIPFIRFVAIDPETFHKKIKPYEGILPDTLRHDVVQMNTIPHYRPQVLLMPARTSVTAVDTMLLDRRQIEWLRQHLEMALTPKKVAVHQRESSSQNTLSKFGGRLLKRKSKASSATPPQPPPPVEKDWTPMRFEFKLLLRASRDGFSAAEFHRRCDLKNSTLIVVKVESDVLIGGYNPGMWSNKHGTFQTSSQAFIFNLGNRDVENAVFSPVSRKEEAYQNTSEGPAFGAGPDLKMGLDGGSWTCIKQSYEHPLLSAGTDVTATEYEVFQVNKLQDRF